jgi:hypothetical protein
LCFELVFAQVTSFLNLANRANANRQGHDLDETTEH